MTDSTCRSCGAPIQWALTPKGRRIPLDMEPVDPEAEGAQILFTKGGVRTAVSWPRAVTRLRDGRGIKYGEAERILREANHKAFLSHFVSCPNAREHRRRR